MVSKQVRNLIKHIKEIADKNNIKVHYVSRQKKFELLSRIKLEQEGTIELEDSDDDDVLINEVKPDLVVIDSDDEDTKMDVAQAKMEVKHEMNCPTGQTVLTPASQPSTSKCSIAEELTSKNPAIKQEINTSYSESSSDSPSNLEAAKLELMCKQQELYREALLNPNSADSEPNIMPAADFLARKKQELMRRQQAHRSAWNTTLAPVADLNTLRTEVAARVNQQRNPNFKGSEDFIALRNDRQSEEPAVTEPERPKESEYIPFSVRPGMSAISTMADYIPVKQENHALVKQEESSSHAPERVLSIREQHDFKYGYYDIISGSFNEKLDEELAKGISINKTNEDINYLNDKYYDEYQTMIREQKYKEMLKFRAKLPAYDKANELLEVINKSSVVVVSGETGCGKSTQVHTLNY